MLLAYNQYWQMPAQTEKHAFLKMQAFLKDNTLNAVYLAFPWATLFDAVDNKNTVLLTELEQALARLTSQIPEDWQVFTVCQHICLSRHQHYLVQAKVKTVFWSHATTTTPELSFSVKAFPLYPVHHGEQITDSQFTAHSESMDTVNATIKAPNCFALCSSVNGLNSIRLWEAVTAGVVPVIISDDYLLPGNALLWQQAAVFCAETPESIAALPEYLVELAADPSVLAAKRHALRQLAIHYGPEGFVIDIMQQMMHYAPAFNVNLVSPLLQLAENITSWPTLENCRHFVLSINSYRLLADPIVFHPKVQQAFALSKATISHAK